MLVYLASRLPVMLVQEGLRGRGWGAWHNFIFPLPWSRKEHAWSAFGILCYQVPSLCSTSRFETDAVYRFIGTLFWIRTCGTAVPAGVNGGSPCVIQEATFGRHGGTFRSQRRPVQEFGRSPLGTGLAVEAQQRA